MAALIEMMPKVMSVIDALSQGKTLTRACQDAGISTTAFHRYVRNSTEFKELYNEAVENGADSLADLLLDIDNPGSMYGSGDPAKMRVMSDNIKWLLSRRRPQQYGDKVTVQHNITADAAIVEALARGRERASSIQIEDATYEVIEHIVDTFDPSEFS